MMAKLERPVAFWLEQIVVLANRVSAHLGGMTVDAFAADAKTVDAVSWCISCIGEAAGRVLQADPGIGERHKGLDLAAAYGARNRYVHGYFDLDTEQMWNTAAFAVPRLSSTVSKILKNEGM